jgi:tetratricopeptide (TPR) repeat protein
VFGGVNCATREQGVGANPLSPSLARLYGSSLCSAIHKPPPPPPHPPTHHAPHCTPFPPTPPAWNNLGDAYERKKQYGEALAAYREVLTYAPDNKVAQARSEYCRTRVQRTA